MKDYMTSLKRWITAVVLDATWVVLLYLWQVRQIEGAGNVFVFIMWFFAIIGIIAASADSVDRSKLAAGPVFRAYQVITDTLFVGSLAWTEHYWAAGMYAIAALLMSAVREKESLKAAAA